MSRVNERRRAIVRGGTVWGLLVVLLVGGWGYGRAVTRGAVPALAGERVALGPVSARLPAGWEPRVFAGPDEATVSAAAPAGDVAVRVRLVRAGGNTTDPRRLIELAYDGTVRLAGYGGLRGEVLDDPPRRVTVAGRPGATATAVLPGYDAARVVSVAGARVAPELVIFVEVARAGDFDGRDALLARAVAESVEVELP